MSDEIVRNVLEAVKENDGKKVLSIRLRIRELTLLNVDRVIFWIHELFKGSVAEAAKVKVGKMKARIPCEFCGYKEGIRSNQEDSFRHLRLQAYPQCRSFQFKVEKRQECILRRIQVVR